MEDWAVMLRAPTEAVLPPLVPSEGSQSIQLTGQAHKSAGDVFQDSSAILGNAAPAETILQNLLSGQYAYPVRIVSFDPVEGWSRDATSDVADALAQRAADTEAEISSALQDFIAAMPHGASTCS